MAKIKIICHMIRHFVVLSLLILFTVSGCATIYNPATAQEEFIFITTPVEVSIGNNVASQISNEFKISKNPLLTSRLNKIGGEVSDVSDRKDLKYHFNVIEDDTLNAFTTPGGYIYVNSGIIEKTTDAELACVIGHEVGHVAARHIAKKMQAQIGYDILMNIATSKSGGKDLQKAASISFDLVMLGYSREDEFLADKLGVKYAHRAGFDPYAMVTMLKKLKGAKEEEIGFVFLRSHPYISQRIKLLEKQIPAVINKDGKDEKLPITTTNQPKRVMCPECKRIFSGNTNYCPYDGTKLQ